MALRRTRLVRKKPLSRGKGGLRRTGAPAPDRGRDGGTNPDPVVVAAVLRRDQGRCARCGDRLWGRRGLHWSIQHRRARGAGGDRRADTNSAQNLIALCGSGTTGCHGWVERNRLAARSHGWAISRWDDPLAEPVTHALYGRVWLDNEGGWSDRPPTTGSEDSCD